jgi:nicotinamidase-related amidase
MQALIIVDAQNEFTTGGHRTVPNHGSAFVAIHRRVEEARRSGWPIAWIRHHNHPHEQPAFQPGTWGAEFGDGLALDVSRDEQLFEKSVYGAFTGTGLEAWLRQRNVTHLLLVGFYVHMCLSTSAREALVRGFEVSIDPNGTGGPALYDPLLGEQTADEVRRTALLQLTHMGVTLTSGVPLAPAPAL